MDILLTHINVLNARIELMKLLGIALMVLFSVGIANANCKISQIEGLPPNISESEIRTRFFDKNYIMRKNGMIAKFIFRNRDCGFDGGSCVELDLIKNGKSIKNVYVINYGASDPNYLLNELFSKIDACN